MLVFLIGDIQIFSRIIRPLLHLFSGWILIRKAGYPTGYPTGYPVKYAVRSVETGARNFLSLKNTTVQLFNRDAPNADFAGYLAGRISGYSESRIPNIRPDIRQTNLYPVCKEAEVLKILQIEPTFSVC